MPTPDEMRKVSEMVRQATKLRENAARLLAQATLLEKNAAAILSNSGLHVEPQNDTSRVVHIRPPEVTPKREGMLATARAKRKRPDHPFETWLFESFKMSPADWARQNKRAYQTVNAWITGGRKIPARVADDIERVSGGKVPRSSWAKVRE